MPWDGRRRCGLARLFARHRATIRPRVGAVRADSHVSGLWLDADELTVLHDQIDLGLRVCNNGLPNTTARCTTPHLAQALFFFLWLHVGCAMGSSDSRGQWFLHHDDVSATFRDMLHHTAARLVG